MIEDCKEYISRCPECLKLRGGKKISLIPKSILVKGAKERYVVDGWALHEDMKNNTGYSVVIDIIDYFSKFMTSIPVKENTAINALLAIKEFCAYVGNPKILQTDNGLEYNNDLIDGFCRDNNIIHIKSRPHHPQSNGVIEVVHKEIRKKVILEFSDDNPNFNLKSVLIDAVNIHNHTIHTTTGFRLIDIINNSDENIMKQVLDNIEKFSKKSKEKYDNIIAGDHLLINANVHKSGKRLVLKKYKNKFRINKIPATVISNYNNGLFAVSIDFGNYELNKN